MQMQDQVPLGTCPIDDRCGQTNGRQTDQPKNGQWTDHLKDDKSVRTYLSGTSSCTSLCRLLQGFISLLQDEHTSK